jgi:hypothetical protein
MVSWLQKKLQDTEKNYPNSKYAYNSTVNWIRSLKILCDESISSESLKRFYKGVQKTNQNKEYNVKAIASIFSSINYLKTLNFLSKSDDNIINSANAYVAVVSWYYCIYNSSKAMIAVYNNSYQDNHTKTANVFYELSKDQKLVMPPFVYSLYDLTKENVKEQIDKYRCGLDAGNKSLSSDYYPTTKSNALECIFSYLKGTADYVKWQEEEKIKGSKEFKDKGFTDFRKKEDQILRDNKLCSKKVTFLTQAFRYRGKANYRDCVYFNDNYDDTRVNSFIGDLEVVAQKFMIMASFYLSRRIAGKEWQEFLDNLSEDYKRMLII